MRVALKADWELIDSLCERPFWDPTTTTRSTTAATSALATTAGTADHPAAAAAAAMASTAATDGTTTATATVAGGCTLRQAAEHLLRSMFFSLFLSGRGSTKHSSHAVPILSKRSLQCADLCRRIVMKNLDGRLATGGDEITGWTLPSPVSSPQQKQLHVHHAAFSCALLVSCSA